MKKTLQILGIFVATVLFLSIELDDKPIFSYIFKTISPMTRTAQNAVANFMGNSIDQTEVYSKKLFDNSTPKLDTVKSKMSSHGKFNGKPQEDITVQEKQELDDLIKSHN